MTFGALSNAAYLVSLRGPGTKLEGDSQEPPSPSGGGKSKGPSGRGLINTAPIPFEFVTRILKGCSR